MAETRLAGVSSSLGKDVLLLYRLQASEELGRLFVFELELLSTDAEIKLDDVLGKPMSVALELPSGETRYLHGVVTRFSQSGRAGRYTEYRATLRPWFWLLTRTADCRVFSDESGAKTVPEIIKDVFRRNGFSDFKERLNGTYKAREYCVQYRETDFNFVSRLMEEEGIYYYFEHKKDNHYLVLADSPTSHDPIPGSEEIPYMAAATDSAAPVDHIAEWQIAQEIQPGMTVLNDYDFEVPRADLTVRSSIPRSHPFSKFEVYDYPGNFVGAMSARGEGTSGDGDANDRGQTFVKARIEAAHTDFEQVQGSGNVRGLAVGGTFKLKEFHRDDQNREHLVVATDLKVQIGGFEGIEGAVKETLYECEFYAIPSKTPFRPERLTPRPEISGPQTATVGGKSGEEIWTDVHGRVKVQFHWDRKGANDENSSCWVRVATPWAGKNWGMVSIPRIGHEVIVEFLEGNPDRPLITGSVYNGQNPPPFKLPGNMTQSGILTRSTKEGTGDNANMLRFEDKKGAEQIYVHAEKDQDIEVEANETLTVGNDRTKTIGHDETTHVKNNRTENVDANESITIGGGRSETVAKDESVTISGGRSVDVSKDESLSVGGKRTQDVAKDETVNVGGGRTQSVAKDEQLTVSGSRSKDVSKNETATINENYKQSVGKDATVEVAKSYSLNAGDEISLENGGATILLKKNGDIEIKGSKIKIEASGEVSIKGSKITQN